MSSGESYAGKNKKIPVLQCSPGANRKKMTDINGKRHQFRHSDSESDSNGSDEESTTDSQVFENLRRSNDPSRQKLSNNSPVKKRKQRKNKQQWEIIEGLKDGMRCEDKPEKYQGYMMKRRRWPMKGWHKRFFSLDKGFLYYSKSPNEVKDNNLFEEWLSRLRHHRLYRQHEISYGTKDTPRLTDIASPAEELPPLTASGVNFPEKSREHQLSTEIIRRSSFKSRDAGSQGRVAAWLLDSAGFEQCNKELYQTQNMLCELQEDLEQIKNIPFTADKAELEEVESSEKKKSRGIMRRRKEKKSDGSVNIMIDDHANNTHPTLTVSQENIRTSSSNPNLMQYEHDKSRPRSVPDYHTVKEHEQRLGENKLRDNFLTKAIQVHSNLKSLLHMMGTERDRLKLAIEHDNSSSSQGAIAALNKSLAEALKQNAELRARLMRINSESSLGDIKILTPSSPVISPTHREHNALSQSMSAESCSISEYYDAEEHYKESASDYSSEPSDEEISSELSEEFDTDITQGLSVSEDQLSGSFATGRRSQLPVAKPDTGDFSLWKLLYKNIGKDLTKMSMPVTLNEPLSALQRLCEELEYSELIDKAAEFDDPYERMVYVAAFAVSCYASSGYRAGHKPFNPLLGETFECIRVDRGWKFVGEQVSHHPPISACHCESKNFVFWQDIRMSTKFWGKSMEIQPVGHVNLLLPKYKDHYKWNKVTTCVHNLLGGQRWVDQFGEMIIRNGDIVCKLTFTKATHMSPKRHEVYGYVLNQEGKIVHNLMGKWNEAFYCGHAPSARCVWRPGAMPDDYELYYGFTRFAIELNELMLEEGKVQEAENEKQRLEHVQRERRKKREEEKIEYHPKWFRKTIEGKKDCYEYAGKYWEMRSDPGFSRMTFPKLW
ncbi:hypothetical protein KUTeg_001623 [Tegillarca granosa]|uniref:Oxysterol-binding protein n=1 Tax=Tegillarca granosa TaxID=220873 RepID=A0ABQ9FV65_TEGGR|nr:hypothetical protein KUTeg_001623 [Tegillarca granosa]